jgi:hypothetical protein
MDGTLFCSECGARLWGDTTDNETSKLDRQSLTEGISEFVFPVFAAPTGFKIQVAGASAPAEFSGKSEYLLGRSDPRHEVVPDMDLSPYGGQHLGVSRKHAVLVQTDTGFSIRDLGSTNGTIVNGKILGANESWPLRDGDEIRLGKLAMNIFFIVPA